MTLRPRLDYMAGTDAHDRHEKAPDATGRAPEPVVWVIVLALVAVFLGVRLRYPSVFEYEAAETSVASAAFVEHGTPPRAYHRIRYTQIFVGPLHAYLKAIPYFFTFDPHGEIVFLNVLNAFAAVLLFFLLRRLFGLFPATLALFLLAFSVPSIERCTALHVRCYSVPLVLIVMVLTARVLLMQEHRLMPLLAVAVAFATQVYGLALFFLPPGLLILFFLYDPRIPGRIWLASAAIFAVLQIPWILDDVWRGIAGPVWPLQHRLFTFPPADAQDVEAARAGALAFIGSISKVVLVDDATMLRVALAGVGVMAASAAWVLLRRPRLRDNRDLFFLLWLTMFLVVPAYLGAGGRVYLAQFLGPVVIARGLTLPLDWLPAVRRRWVRAAGQALAAAAGGVAIWVAIGYFAGPRPTTILSDPSLPHSLEEVRSVVRYLHQRGLGRIGFNERVHGAILQTDVFADSYLFWTVCHDDPQVPCAAGAGVLPAQTHFVVLEPEFPFQPAEGTVVPLGSLRLVEYESRVRLPFQAIAFPAARSAAEPGGGRDERFAGPLHALRSPPIGTTSFDEADRFARLELWPSDRPGVAVFPIRRSSQVAALIVEHGLDGSFAEEARYHGPEGSPLEVVLHGTLEIDRLPDPGQELHFFVTASSDGGRCQASILLDGVPLRQSRFENAGDTGNQALVKLEADATPFVRAGRHAVSVRLHDCSAELYDFYDLVVRADRGRAPRGTR